MYQRLLAALIEAGSQLLEPGERRITLGDVVLLVLPVPGIASWGHNNNSVDVIVEYGEFRASMLGDAESRQQDWLIATVPHALTRVQGHKAAHHGSANGDTASMMQRLSPELVVVSAGAGNSYGHPAASALALYASVGATVVRTDLHGNAVVRGNADGTFKVSTSRTTAPTTPAPPPAAAPAPQPPPPAPPRSCCRACRTGKACGDSCIARDRTCTRPPGCACNADLWTDDDLIADEQRWFLPSALDVVFYLIAEPCDLEDETVSAVIR